MCLIKVYYNTFTRGLTKIKNHISVYVGNSSAEMFLDIFGIKLFVFSCINDRKIQRSSCYRSSCYYKCFKKN